MNETPESTCGPLRVWRKRALPGVLKIAGQIARIAEHRTEAMFENFLCEIVNCRFEAMRGGSMKSNNPLSDRKLPRFCCSKSTAGHEFGRGRDSWAPGFHAHGCTGIITAPPTRLASTTFSRAYKEGLPVQSLGSPAAVSTSRARRCAGFCCRKLIAFCSRFQAPHIPAWPDQMGERYSRGL